MTRREMFAMAGSAALLSPLATMAAADAIPNPKGKRGMGGAPTAFSARNGGGRGGGRAAGAPGATAAAGGARPGRPFSEEFFDYCHSLGLGGAEMGAPPMEPDAIAKFRDKVQSYNMFVMFDIPLPRTDADVERFDAQVKAASEVGAYGLHSAMTQRRYEEFSSLDDFKKSFETNQAIVARAEPILRKHKVRLGLENHKGWSAVEQAAWMKRLGSDYVGVHFDFGNNISFLEDPMFTLETLKPWIFSCHIKDMAVEKYDKGFLLSEVPMGEGFLDLKKMVEILRAKNPDMPLDLEMITRDPLEVPIYTDKYWVTFPDMPGKQVAHMMEIIEKNPPKKPLPHTSGLDPESRKKLEEGYNLQCIRYARESLGL
jgi:sugar phosphate isomerase/epimerase